MKTLKDCLATVKDPRRGQGKRYDLVHTLLYCVLAVASGATSYRKIHAFIDTHWERLNAVFGSTFKRAPAYTAVRKIVQGLDAAEVERALRLLAGEQVQAAPEALAQRALGTGRQDAAGQPGPVRGPQGRAGAQRAGGA